MTETDVRINIRITVKERLRIKKLAKKDGLTVSQYVRNKVLKKRKIKSIAGSL